MTEQSETPKILDEIAKGTKAKSTSAISRSRKKARRRFLVVLLLFLPLLGGLVYLGYLQFNRQAEMTTLRQQTDRLEVALARSQTQLDELSTRLASEPQPAVPDDSAARELGARIDAELAILRQQIDDLAMPGVTQAAPQDLEWKILEANYLVQLAGRKLQLEADQQTAMLLLEQADAALVESGSNRVLRARQAMANDMTRLREFRAFDREGLYLRLNSLQEQINNIDLLTSMRENFRSRQSQLPSPAEAPALPQGPLQSSLNLLRSVFIWRNWEESPEAALIPGQEALILQRMHLNLERVQLALMRADTALYQRSIADGIAWLRQYAMRDSSAGRLVLEELSALQQIDIEASPPEIDQSVILLQQLADSIR